jgi:uncharacterized membrane protein YheB (UPF0754 family)
MGLLVITFGWKMLAMPLIAALIGWLTNWVAVKMLFRPKLPINLGLFTLQGVFPKRKEVFAQKIGDLVANQLFSLDDIKDKFSSAESQESIIKMIDERIETFLRTKLLAEMPMLAFIMNDTLIGKIKGTLMAEIKDMLPTILEDFADNMSSKIDINQIVRDKVSLFSTDKMEELLMSILQKEFKFIELVGAVLGFLIGCVQLLLIG